MKNIKKLTAVIIRPNKNLLLKVNVNVKEDNNVRSFHTVNTVNGNDYLTLDTMPFLTLELKDKEGGGDWKDKAILINQNNIYQIVKGFEKCLENIYNGGVFAVDKQGNSIIFADMVEKNTVRIFNLGANKRMVIKPAVIFDENETQYEGVILYINKTANFVELTIDALEALYYCLSKIDIFSYAQLLLNYYVSVAQKEGVDVAANKNTIKKRSPDIINKKDKEFTTATVYEKPGDFFKINGLG